MNQNYLAHYGIRGMKWGVRRTLAQLGRALKGSPGKGSAVKKPAAPPKPKPKSLSEMSDDELRAKLNRFDMEKRYKQYLAEMNPKRESMVKKVAMRVLENGLTTLGNKAFERIGQNLMDKAKEDETPVSALLKKDPSKLSDKDLQRVANRLTNENNLKNLLNPEKKSSIGLLDQNLSKASDSEIKSLSERVENSKKIQKYLDALEEDRRKSMYSDGGGI